MATINPNEYTNNPNSASGGSDDDLPRINVETAGVKILKIVGACYRQTMAGQQQLEIAFCALESDNAEENGGLYMESFSLADNVLWRLGELSAKVGYMTPWDAEKMDDVLSFINSDECKPFRANIKDREYNDKIYLSIKYFDYHKGSPKLTEAQKSSCTTCVGRYDALVTSRVDNGWSGVIPITTGNNSNSDAGVTTQSDNGHSEIPF